METLIRKCVLMKVWTLTKTRQVAQQLDTQNCSERSFFGHRQKDHKTAVAKLVNIKRDCDTQIFLGTYQQKIGEKNRSFLAVQRRGTEDHFCVTRKAWRHSASQLIGLRWPRKKIRFDSWTWSWMYSWETLHLCVQLAQPGDHCLP